MITFEERYAYEMQRRRERPFAARPVYRFQEGCGVCGSETDQHGDACTYEKRRGTLPIERIIRSYQRLA